MIPAYVQQWLYTQLEQLRYTNIRQCFVDLSRVLDENPWLQPRAEASQLSSSPLISLHGINGSRRIELWVSTGYPNDLSHLFVNSQLLPAPPGMGLSDLVLLAAQPPSTPPENPVVAPPVPSKPPALSKPPAQAKPPVPSKPPKVPAKTSAGHVGFPPVTTVKTPYSQPQPLGRNHEMPMEVTHEMMRELRGRLDELPEERLRAVMAITMEPLPDSGQPQEDVTEVQLESLDQGMLLRLYELVVLGTGPTAPPKGLVTGAAAPKPASVSRPSPSAHSSRASAVPRRPAKEAALASAGPRRAEPPALSSPRPLPPITAQQPAYPQRSAHDRRQPASLPSSGAPVRSPYSQSPGPLPHMSMPTPSAPAPAPAPAPATAPTPPTNESASVGDIARSVVKPSVPPIDLLDVTDTPHTAVSGERAQALAKLESSLHSQAAALYYQSQLDAQQLAAASQTLVQIEMAQARDKDSLLRAKETLLRNIEVLRRSTTRAKDLAARAAERPPSESATDLVAVAASDRALVEAYSGSCAIDDLLRVLPKALDAGSLSLHVYLRLVRQYAREQFSHRHALLRRRPPPPRPPAKQ